MHLFACKLSEIISMREFFSKHRIFIDISFETLQSVTMVVITSESFFYTIDDDDLVIHSMKEEVTASF